jgi:hypothetical protein
MRRQPGYPCSTCGGFARIPVENGKQFACARCGTVLQPLPFGGNAVGRIPNPTPIRHGMKATIGGKEFWAIGLIRFEEPEEEGGVSEWHEWVLMNPDGDIRYLEYDEGRWTMTGPFDPGPGLEGVFGAGSGAVFNIGGKRAMIQETGVCRVDNFEGQIPWEIRRGESLRYADLTSGNTFFSAETSPETGLIEWFQGRRMDDREVLTIFGLEHVLTKLDRKQHVKGDRRFFGWICLALSLLAFILYGMSFGSGKVIAAGKTTGQQAGEDGYRFGPYNLDKVNRVYRLRISSQLSSTSMWVQGVVEAADFGAVFDVNEEFWDESGYDDGSWHEWVLESHKEFRLDAPRQVFIRLYADPEAAAMNAPISFQLEEGVRYPRHFLTFGLIFSFVGICWLIAGAEGTGGKAWEGA